MERSGVRKLDLLMGDNEQGEFWDFLEEAEVEEEAIANAVESKEGYTSFEESEASKFRETTVSGLQGIYAYRMESTARRNAIKREALMDAEHLAEFIPKYKLSELIRVYTEVNTNTINALASRINNRATTFLWKLIPRRLRNVYKDFKDEYPHFMNRSPGFLYRFVHEDGEVYSLWVEPDIPCIIPQFSEQKYIDEDETYKDLMRRGVLDYYRALANRSKIELRLASKLYNVTTMYDLLNADPDLYKLFREKGIDKISRRIAKRNLKTRFK